MRTFALLLLLLWQDAPSVPKSEFKERRDRLAKKLSDGLIVLRAQELREGEPGIDENTARFDFSYLAGAYEAGAVLVIYGDTSIVFARDARKSWAVDKVLALEKYEAFLKETLPAAKKVYDWRHPWAPEDKPASQKFKDINPDILVQTNISAAVTQLRIVKSDAELKCLRKAADATNKAHVNAMKNCKPGKNEADVQKIIEDTFRKEGCPTNAFGCICAGGKNAVTLHYMENKADLAKETMIVMDIGAEYQGYAADITRTIPVDGKFTADHKKAYQAVLDSQRAAEAKLKPGASWADLDAAAAAVLRERGYGKTGYMSFHGLGHHVGLSVHDSSTYAERFKVGMVITIEPGIYDRKNGYGIRIEDTYVVTKDGFERISAGAPREVEEIEKIMSGDK